jgi:hypothetical protein
MIDTERNGGEEKEDQRNEYEVNGVGERRRDGRLEERIGRGRVTKG